MDYVMAFLDAHRKSMLIANEGKAWIVPFAA
jgi:hypothetical protein